MRARSVARVATVGARTGTEREAAALGLAEKVCMNAPLAQTATLRAVAAAVSAQDERGWAATEQPWVTIESSADAAEGKAAFTEKRMPRWTGT